jgi:hypothetical protein
MDACKIKFRQQATAQIRWFCLWQTLLARLAVWSGLSGQLVRVFRADQPGMVD